MLIDREMFENMVRAGWCAQPQTAVRSARVAGAVAVPPAAEVPALAQWAADTMNGVEAIAAKNRRNQKALEEAEIARAHVAAEIKGDIAEANRLLSELVAAGGAKPAAKAGESVSAEYYLEVSEDEVPVATQVRAYLSMARALEAVGMEAPALRWFRPESEAEKADRLKAHKEGRTVERAPVPANSWGVARYVSNSLWLAADIPLEEVAFTIAHEVAHFYQMQQIPHLRIKANVTAREREWMEWDADVFAARFMKTAAT